MKRLLLAAIGLCLIAAFFLVPKHSPESTAADPASFALPVSSRNTSTALAPLPIPPGPAVPAAESRAELSGESRAAVYECLGEEAPDWSGAMAAVERRARGPRSLQWRVIEINDGGQPVRIRLAREPNEAGKEILIAKLFSVDADGLPDPLPDQPGQRENANRWLNEYLKGKAILQDSRAEEITLPGGQTLHLETEGNEVTEAQFTGPGKSLACSRRAGEPRCRCL